MLLDVDVNDQGLHDTVVVLRTANGNFLLNAADLKRWRIKLPAAAPAHHGTSGDYFALTSIPGAKAAFDVTKQTLALTFPPSAFESSTARVPPAGQAPPPVLPQLGGFFNYNVSSTRAPGSNLTSGQFEAGVFGRRGTLDSTFLAPQLGANTSVVRLESTYELDYPGKLASLRVGDGINGAGSWGLPVRFGGIQYATNFGTQPGFIHSPISTAASGLATLPSVVDVFVNNALVSKQSVPPGPFSITNIPAVSGSGDVRLVVRDLLGREQVITQPFYHNLSLLSAGLEQFSYDVGVARQDFGLASDRYGSGLATATYRRGLTQSFTAEAHGELASNLADVGFSASALLGRLGLLNGTLAGSSSDRGTGMLGGWAFERQGRTVSFTLQSQWTTPEFRQIGMTAGQLPRQRQSSGTVGVQMGGWGSVSTTYVDQAWRDQPRNRVLSIGYNLPLSRYAQLTLSALRSIGNSGGKTVFVTLAIPIDGTTSATLTRERDLNPQSGTATVNSLLVQKSLPVGDGYGYRLEKRGQASIGSLSVQNDVGTYQIEASSPTAGRTSTRLTVTGGIGMVGDKAFLSRQITNSFGVVRVADYPNVSVLQDNQVVAKTNRQGYAVLPRLRPYDRNVISVNQNDVPLDAVIGSSSLVAVPYFKSGVMLDFPIKRTRAGVLRVTDEKGVDVPSGALAHIEGSSEEFPVALRGELYLSGFKEEQNRVIVKWKDSSCEIDVAYPRTTDPLPTLGTYVCKGLKR